MKNLLIVCLFLFLSLSACKVDVDTHDSGHQVQPPGAEAEPQAAPEPAADPQADYRALVDAAVNHPDRPPADKQRDAQRKPAEVITFFDGLKPGMTVLDLFTGGGYYAELAARIAGPEGSVWAQNPGRFYENFGDEGITLRLANNRLPNVIRYDRDMDNLGLPENTFDAAIAAMVLHDFFWLSEDVPTVLLGICKALKPGGKFLITDHAAPDGTGNTMALKFRDGQHRIDEAYVVQIMTEAGFELVDSSDLLRVLEDDRSLPFFAEEMRGKYTDRFVLVFTKPEAQGRAEVTRNGFT